MRDHQTQFSVSAMCRVLEINPSCYYAWRTRQPSASDRENERLLAQIKTIHDQSRRTYGSPKLYQQLRRDVEQVNHKRVERLMRENGLRAKRVKKYRQRSDSRHSLPVAENVLERNFSVARPGEVWTTEITYIWTAEGWLYLVVFLDLYSRMVVGWAVSERMTVEFVEAAFLQAQRRRAGAVSPLVHSDGGSQYASSSFREHLAAWGCTQSMSRRGNCWDNAVTESFFGILKNELIHHERFCMRQEAKDKLFDYIEVFYNRSRIHSATEYFAPAEYEARYEAQLKQVA
jgi:transposase InsO family protein